MKLRENGMIFDTDEKYETLMYEMVKSSCFKMHIVKNIESGKMYLGY